MSNQAVSFKPDCGLALWYMGDVSKVIYMKALESMAIERITEIIPNHELRISDIYKKYCFGTATLVTPKLKTIYKVISGKDTMDTILYII